jgi:hypothetical protein
MPHGQAAAESSRRVFLTFPKAISTRRQLDKLAFSLLQRWR